MKKYMFFIFLALFLSGCDTKQPSAEQLASQLVNQLTFPDIATEDLVFPSSYILDTHEVALTWHSNNPDSIDSSGFVYPQASPQEVSISATLTYNGSSHIVDYGIIQVPAWNKSALNIPISTSTKLNFPQETLLNGRLVSLVWHSDNDEVIAANGDVFPSITPRTSRVWAQILYKDTISILDFGLVQVVSWSNEEIKSYLTEHILLPDSTKEHIVLPEELAVDFVSVLLTWTSSHPNVISNDGTVTPSSTNVDVTLHLQASFQEQTLDFDFKTITVLANTPAEHLQFVKTKVIVPESTKTNITLEKSVDGVAINWFSTHPNILNNKGEWFFSPEDTLVTLTAVFSYSGQILEVNYPILVLTYTHAERLTLAYESLVLPSTAQANLELQKTFAYFVTANWTSSNEAIITNWGAVNLSSIPQVVTLTANFKSGTETMKKEFEITTTTINANESYFSEHMYTHRINDFLDLNLNNLEKQDEKIVLNSSSLIGTYESSIINTQNFNRMVGSWSAISSQQATVELKVRVRVNGTWSSYLSYSAWGLGKQNAMYDQNGGVASMNDDEVVINNSQFASAFQFYVTLKRDSLTVASPKLWLVGISLSMPTYQYPVDTSTLPDFVDYNVPQLYQYDVPTIGGSICSITSSTMLLMYHGHTFSSSLPHGENSPLFKDYGNNIYGNWVFNTVGMSSFGETSYVKKIYSWDELRYHLANVGPVAVSIKGNTGLYTTNGHLIVVRGYEIVGDQTYVITNDPALKSVYYKYTLTAFLSFTRDILYVVE